MAVNKKHYYFSLDAMSRIEEAYFADYRSGHEREQTMKAVWYANFKLYTETEKILDRIKDPHCDLFPLYRGLGQEDAEFEFDTREQAEKEYTEHINISIADRLYDL